MGMEDLQRPQPITFDGIATKYDFLNHFLSFGIDVGWRRKLIRRLANKKPSYILDVATGTADLAIMAAKKIPCQIVGCDIANKMLEIGKRKIEEHSLNEKIQLLEASAEDLPFADNTFDAIMVAFGVRNFRNLGQGLSEMHRVLKPDGFVFILEFSIPENKFVRGVYLFYFRHILPLVGGWISRNREAYTYLPQSVEQFPQGKDFTEQLLKVGFQNNSFQALTFGIATLYEAKK